MPSTPRSWEAIFPRGRSDAPVTVRVRRTTTQSIPNNTNTNITWESALWDTDGLWTAGTDVVIRRAGYYLVIAAVEWDIDPVGLRAVTLLRNGVVGHGAAETTGPADALAQGVSAVIPCDPGDTLRVRVLQASGAPLLLTNTAGMPSLLVHRLSY